MLSASHRLRRSADFTHVVRGGVRAGRPSVVVHARVRDETPDPARTARVGFVVSKAIGNAVTRNRVKRRLRALVRDRVADVDPQVDWVVRALAPAAHTPELAGDLDSAWRRAEKRLAA